MLNMFVIFHNIFIGNTSVHHSDLFISSLVGPQKPVVNIESSAELTSELAVNLTCSSNGGNPPPRVNWYRNGRQITGGDYLVEPETKFGTTVSVLAWTLAREDHNATFVCSVENKGNSGSPIYSKREVLNVQCEYR